MNYHETRSRIVLPDGNGRDFPADLGLEVGDILEGDKHDGLNGWTVYRVVRDRNDVRRENVIYYLVY